MTQWIFTGVLAVAITFDFAPRAKANRGSRREYILYFALALSAYCVLMLSSFNLIPGIIEPVLHFMTETLHLH